MSDTNKEKVVHNVRISQKHDTEAKWNESPDFIPKAGEEIIYDPDENYAYSRSKIGDGITRLADLPFYNPQGDMEQSDPNAADFIKNRTHYREVKEYNHFEYKSTPGEEVIGDGFIPIKKSFDGLVLGETYRIEVDIFDEDDNYLETQVDEEGIAATLSEMTEEEGFENVIVIYSPKFEVPVFINAIKFTDGGIETDVKDHSYGFSAGNFSDYNCIVKIYGTGLVYEEYEYTKIPVEYLPDNTINEEIVDSFKVRHVTNYAYPYSVLYDYRGDSLDTDHGLSSRYYVDELYSEKGYGNTDIHGNKSDGYSDFIYYVTDVDTENKRFSVFWNKSGDNKRGSGSYDYRLDYSCCNYTPRVGDILAFSTVTTNENGIKVVPFRVLGKSDPSNFGDLVASISIFSRPSKDFNKATIHLKRVIIPNLQDDSERADKVDASFSTVVLSTLSSMFDNQSNDAFYYKNIDESTYEISDDGSAPTSDLFFSRSDSTYKTKYLMCEIHSIIDIIIEKDFISTRLNTHVNRVGSAALGWEDYSSEATTGPTTVTSTSIIRRNEDCTSFDDFRELDIKLWLYTQFLQGSTFDIEWRK